VKIAQLHIKQFRCFSDIVIPCNYPAVLIVGNNGTGKTSILEALHYVCYLRSFRTHSPKELIQFDQETFFIKVTFKAQSAGDLGRELQVGFSPKKRLVKLDKRTIVSYKELLDHYRVVTITEDDLELIKGGPEYRRMFIDQALFLMDGVYTEQLKKYRQVLENRNALLQHHTVDMPSYHLWTEQLFEISELLAHKRIEWLSAVERIVQELLVRYVDPEISVSFEYQSKKSAYGQSYDQFMQSTPSLYEQEMRFRRSLFGVHLDDFLITFQGKRSRQFASRGQQKLLVLLVKVAQIKYMHGFAGSILFLLDDFMTDFDEQRVSQLIPLLSGLGCQLIFTSPCKGRVIDGLLMQHGAHLVDLTHSNT